MLSHYYLWKESKIVQSNYKNTNLTSTPIVFYIDEETKTEFRRDLDIILKRRDVRKEQLFFMINPLMDHAQITRVICDLGVEKTSSD